MKRSNVIMLEICLLGLMSVTASAQTYQKERAAALRESNKERGFHFNNLSISPFVNVEYKYDSNVDTDYREYDDSSFSVNPGVDLKYVGNNWGFDGSGFYGYEWFHDYDELDSERYGERLSFWAESEKGWRFLLGQRYLFTSSQDSILDGGRGVWRDRETIEVNSALSYQFSEVTGLSLAGAYSEMDYKNQDKEYAPMYGWKEWSGDMQFSRKLTEKSNFLLSAGIQHYESDGTTGGVNDESMGYTFMAGLGSRATQRITYSLLTGIMLFDYANDELEKGWSYSVDLNWVINKKLAFSMAGSSYFQPSESSMNQASEVYSISGGLTYRPFKKFSTHWDVAYRREEEEYRGKEVDNLVSTRLRADYELIRTSTISANLYSAIEFAKSMSDDDYDDYDQIIGTVGMRFFY